MVCSSIGCTHLFAWLRTKLKKTNYKNWLNIQRECEASRKNRCAFLIRCLNGVFRVVCTFWTFMHFYSHSNLLFMNDFTSPFHCALFFLVSIGACRQWTNRSALHWIKIDGSVFQCYIVLSSFGRSALIYWPIYHNSKFSNLLLFSFFASNSQSILIYALLRQQINLFSLFSVSYINFNGVASARNRNNLINKNKNSTFDFCISGSLILLVVYFFFF